MNDINALLNLGNTDYQSSLFNRKKDREEELRQISEEQRQQQADLLKEQNAVQAEVQAQVQQTVRDARQLGDEIQHLSWAQAQKMLEAVTLRIASSGSNHLLQMQSPGARGLLPSAYI